MMLTKNDKALIALVLCILFGLFLGAGVKWMGWV
jgi:hypothetical protein